MFLFFVSLLFAQPEVYVTAEPKILYADDTLKLTFTSNAPLQNHQVFYQTNDFEEINSSSSSSTSSVFDGQKLRTESKYQIIKLLQPNKTGKLSIQNIYIQDKQQKISLPDQTIEVKSTPPSPSSSTKSIFLTTETARNTYFKGEQIIVEYNLYTQQKILNAEVNKFPEFKNFLREDLILPYAQPPMVESVELDHQIFEKRLLLRVALTPLIEGTLHIEPIKIRYEYLPKKQSRGFFGEDDDEESFFGFFRQIAPKVAFTQSSPVEVMIRPLPLENQPKDFSHLVGNVNIAAVTDKTELKTGEPLHLTVQVEANTSLSNLKLAPFANLDFEVYEPEIQSHLTPSGQHQKTFQFIAMPKKPGNIEIPAINIHFFDPLKQQYVTHSTQPIPLKITGEALLESSHTKSVSTPTKSEKLPFIYDTQEEKQEYWGLRILFLKVLAFALFCYLVFRIFLDSIQKSLSHPRIRLLKKLQKFSHTSDPKLMQSLYQALSEALWILFHIKLEGLLKEELKDILEEKIPQDEKGNIDSILQFLSDYEIFVYSTYSLADTQRIQTVQNLIRSLKTLLMRFK